MHFLFVVLVGLMLLPYIFTPKTAVIYYANSASEVTFRLNVPERQTFDVRSNDAKSGYVLFEPVEGAGLSLENTLAEEDMYTYSGQTRVDSNGSYLHITFEKADRSAFSCKIEIEQDKEHDGEMNRIHVSDLPEDVEILFNNGMIRPFMWWKTTDSTEKSRTGNTGWSSSRFLSLRWDTGAR